MLELRKTHSERSIIFRRVFFNSGLVNEHKIMARGSGCSRREPRPGRAGWSRRNRMKAEVSRRREMREHFPRSASICRSGARARRAGERIPRRKASRVAPRNRSAAVCGRGGTSRSNVAEPHALRRVEDNAAALRNGRFMGRAGVRCRNQHQKLCREICGWPQHASVKSN